MYAALPDRLSARKGMTIGVARKITGTTLGGALSVIETQKGEGVIGARRKFHIDEVTHYGYGRFGVVIDYRVKGAQSQYRIVRLDYPTGPAWGRPIWLNAEALYHLSGRTYWRATKRPKIRRVVGANEKLGSSTDRGCRCQCCPHTAIPRSVVAEEVRDNAD